MRVAVGTVLTVLACAAATAVQAAPDNKLLQLVKDIEKNVDEALAVKKTAVEAALGGPCEPGYYFPDVKEPCQVCGEDAFCPGGKLNERCPANFTTAGVETASSIDECIITCPEGTYAVVNNGQDATCLSCGPGFFCPGGPQATEERVSCRLGFTTVVNDATGEEDCIIVCDPGQYAADKYGPCADCGDGNVCAGGPQPIPITSPCPPAAPFTDTATSSDPGQCVGCQAGTSLVNNNCVVLCQPGYYATSPTATECQECGFGSWCPGGAQPTPQQTACPAGTATQTPTSGSAAACGAVCEPGTYIPAGGSLPCTPCGLDYYCPGGPQDVPSNRVACPASSFTPSPTSADVGDCKTCAVGTPPSCTVTSCQPGYYAATPTGSCVACGVGYTCPGGPQATPQRTKCSDGLTTVTDTSTAQSECVRECDPGYYAATPMSTCERCGVGNYCPGGIQDTPKKDPCPPSYSTLGATSSAQAQCLIVCDPGYYSSSPQGPPPCTACGLGSYCAGGIQDTPKKRACPTGETTTTETAASSAECVAFECPAGLLPITTPPLSDADCGVVECNPCGSANPDVYYTGKLNVYKVPSWSNTTTAAGDAGLLCSLDRADPMLCSQKSTAQNDACTTNDIAVDGAGNLYVLGRTGGTYATSGWIIRIPAGQPAGAPCDYELVQSGITPYAGLGAAPNSNLLYAVGDNSVLTLEIETDGSLTTKGSIVAAGFTGAGDITASPDGKVYAISSGGNAAYEVTVDQTTYVPTGVVTPAVATTGSTYPAAFCTTSGPVGTSSFGPFGQVSSFTSGTFTKVGTSGQLQADGLTGAAVAPVCGTVPVPP